MPEVHHSPPPLHHPSSHSDVRPRGILKNPSFSGPSGGPSGGRVSPEQSETATQPPSTPLDPVAEKERTMQNTLQNAGHRRSSSAARRASTSRRHSSAAGVSDDDPNKMRLQWDEANLYLAEQEKGGRMKITEPKTPYQHGDQGAMEEDEEEDVAIDPRYVNVDEFDLAKNKSMRKPRESEIPGLDIGEPEDEFAQDPGQENARVLRSGSGSLSRGSSNEKHVSVSADDEGFQERVGMPTREEQEKHRHFEEQRKKHYEMRDVKGMLGHSEELDEDDDAQPDMPKDLPQRGINGTR